MKRQDVTTFPQLIYKLERGGVVGYLQPDTTAIPMKIGPIASPEFKLVESLFSTTDSHTYKRLMKRDTKHLYSRARVSLTNAIQRLRYTQAGKYLSFTQGPTYVSMNIHTDRRFA